MVLYRMWVILLRIVWIYISKDCFKNEFTNLAFLSHSVLNVFNGNSIYLVRLCCIVRMDLFLHMHVPCSVNKYLVLATYFSCSHKSFPSRHHFLH